MIVAVALFTAALIPTAAQLEPRAPIGSRIKRDPESVKGERAARIRKAFARCIHARNPRAADRLLRVSDSVTVKLEAAGIDARKLHDTFGMQECLGNAEDSELSLSMKPQTLRGMLVEEAYLATVKVSPAPVGADEPAVVRTFASTGAELEQAQGMGILADCIVTQDASGSDTLLRTAGGTDEEKLAARGLVPAISGCLPDGLTIKLTPLTIRTLAADGLWQRYVAGAPRATN